MEKDKGVSNKTLITVIGPTGIGKTALAIALARHYNTEIISSDSRQFFKEMRIGTAVPSREELDSVPHHFIQHLSIHQPYTVGDFEREAAIKLSKLFAKHDKVVMVGGSGLYVKAVLEGLDNFPEVDPNIRGELKANLEKNGLSYLQEELKRRDPKSFELMDIQNTQRLIRALEICIGTGSPYSSFLTAPKKKRDFESVKIGLEAPRELVYQRIEQRVDQMISDGLLEEAKALLAYKSLNALQTVGYKELFEYFEGRCSLEEAVFEIKKNTRRFAKRQGTWFRKETGVNWFDIPPALNKITDLIDGQRAKS